MDDSELTDDAIPPHCPICDSPRLTGFLHIHLKTKYDESIFGNFVLQDHSAPFSAVKVSEWISRILGPTVYLCLEELTDGNVKIHGEVQIKGQTQIFQWSRVSSPIVLIQILKDDSLFTILLDPKLTG